MVQRRVVLSVEQAVSLPYATLRFAQLGWRVIRVESTPRGQRSQPGDPNRYAGRLFADEGRRSFFVPPNVGKEAIALDLKQPAGRSLLNRIIEGLRVDVFCCNLLPAHHESLGVDYGAIRAVRDDIVWASISAMGTAYPDEPGYDPIIQAKSGLMATTGFPDGPPTLTGVQITDLKAGDELYANVILALLERSETGRGKRIDVSMLQAATSWLVTMLPNVDMGTLEDTARSGNFHRIFVPTGVYRAADGFVYLAIGNTGQWRALMNIPTFAHIDEQGRWDTIGARIEGRQALVSALSAAISQLSAAEVSASLTAARIPNTSINTVEDVHAHPAIRPKLLRTTTPDGHEIRLAPMAVDVPGAPQDYRFAPVYGAHTDSVLTEIGLSNAECLALREAGVVA